MAKRILIVDDEPHFRFDVAIVLRKAEYKISEAANGEEALSKIMEAQKNEDPFDLLVTDIQMPRMSGIELINELKRKNISIPVLAVTGFNDRTLMRELSQKGHDYLEKPFDPREMIMRIHFLLKGNESSRNQIEV